MIDNSGSNVQLSVITPSYNEESVIKESVRKLVQALDKFPETWELVLVNDGSTDNTLDIMSEVARGDNRIKVVSYKNNRGRGYALRMGFRNCVGKYVVTIESDLTWGEDIILSLYEELLNEDADVVIASPYTKGGRLENVPLKRALLSRLGNKLLRVSVPLNITMLSGMTRAYKGDVIRNLPLEEDGKEIHLEIVSKASMLGYRFSEIPAILKWQLPQKGAPKRKSKFRAGKLIRSHLLFGFHESPILLFGTMGGAALLLGFILGLYLCYLYFIREEVIGDRVALILTTIFLILAGFSTSLFCFLSYQIRDLKEEIFKLRHRLYRQAGDN